MCQIRRPSGAASMQRMPFLILIDANVPIYAAGRSHPLKARCQQVAVSGIRRLDPSQITAWRAELGL